MGTSVVQRQLPARTSFITSTQVQQVVNTRTIQGPNQFRTSTVQRQQVVPTTIVSREFDNQFVLGKMLSPELIPGIKQTFKPRLSHKKLYPQELFQQPFTQLSLLP